MTFLRFKEHDWHLDCFYISMTLSMASWSLPQMTFSVNGYRTSLTGKQSHSWPNIWWTYQNTIEDPIWFISCQQTLGHQRFDQVARLTQKSKDTQVNYCNKEKQFQFKESKLSTQLLWTFEWLIPIIPSIRFHTPPKIRPLMLSI